MEGNQNNWINREEYPFESRWFDLAEGRMHYIDEGEGEVLLFVHGTPTWSYLYRHQIRTLSKEYRCIAVDHLGFGLSEKPANFDGTPRYHANNLERLIEHLRLDQFHLVVHDFGGPIGLGAGLQMPEKLKSVSIFNTWLWSTKDNPAAKKVNGFIKSAIGKWLYLNTQFSPFLLLKRGFKNKKLLSRKTHQQYLNPFQVKKDRYGLYRIAQSLVGASDWYESQRAELSKLSEIPVMIHWGLHDKFIQTDSLKRWEEELPHAVVKTYECGHFVMEESQVEVTDNLLNFFRLHQVNTADSFA